MSRKQLGWIMGAIGVLLIAAALLIGQDPFAQEQTPQEVALEPTPSPALVSPTAVMESPLAVSPLAASPLAPPDDVTQAGAAVGGVEPETGRVWLPTVVADAHFEPESGEEPGEPHEPEVPEEPEEPEEPAGAPVYEVRKVKKFPHDPGAFTQGLEFRDGELFEGTGLYGESFLRRVELETGDVLQQVDLESRYFGEGITVFEDRIFQLTWQSREGFIYDRATFEQTGTITYTTEGWGLTHDGERLIMSDGSASLYYRDPATFEVIETIEVSDAGDLIVRLNELEYIDGEIWANIWLTDRIARIDPESGAVIAWLDLAGLLPAEERENADAVLNGIAFDAETGRIFVTGKLWPYLFEIQVVDPDNASDSEDSS